MIFQAIVFLWIFLAAVAIRSKSVPTAVFVACAVGHHVLCGGIDGPRYYVTAAAFDSMAVVLLWTFVVHDRRDRTARRLQTVSVVSMVLNLVGLLMYQADFLMSPYNAAFVIIYSAALASTSGGIKGVGGHPQFRPNLRRSSDSLSEKQL